MIIEEFNAFDIGQQYLKLQDSGVPDADIGGYLRRFVETLAPLIAIENGNIGFGVETERCEKEQDDSFETV